MNAGLEDVRVLYDKLDEYLSPWTEERDELRAKALSAYTSARHPDAVAINDLALRNYQEMRSDVRSPIYRFRKYVEESLYNYAPSLGWATQYSRVSFGNERYSDVEKRAQWQGKTLGVGLVVVLGGLASWGVWWIWRWNQASNSLEGLTKMIYNLGSRVEQVGRKRT
jgi:kynurenine 3-monooxygenase